MTFRRIKETGEIKELIRKRVTKVEEISDYILAVIEREDAVAQRKFGVTLAGIVKFRMSQLAKPTQPLPRRRKGRSKSERNTGSNRARRCKMERLRKVCIGAALFVIACCIHCAGLCQALFNYDDDPDLAKALEYDGELNGGDSDKADRALAERHYLAYLERCRDSFQRARVYYELGVMYCTGVNPKKGEKPDYDKARSYLQKCLEEEPERIGRATLAGRTQLASIIENREERVRAGMDLYEWFLNTDEKRVRRLWLPARPDEIVTERQIGIMVSRAKKLGETVAYNAVFGARSLGPKSEPLLKEIIRRFPGTYAGGLAEGLLMGWPPVRPKDGGNLR